MRRADIDRWTAKRFRSTPRAKGFIIRRGDADVEAFQAAEYAEVSGFCRPGDVILAIMPDDSVGLTYRVDDGNDDSYAAAGVTGSLIKVVGEQVGKSHEGVIAAYEAVIASLRADLARKDAEIDKLAARVEKSEGKSIDLVRMEYQQRIEESTLRHNQGLREEYLGRAFTVLDQVIDGYLKHQGKRDKLKRIFDKLSPETLRTIVKDLDEDDVNDLMTLADDLEKEEKFSSAPKEPKKLSN